MTKGKTSAKSPYQDEIEKARRLRDSGMDIHQIADRFGRPYRTVYGWVRNVRTEEVIKGCNADRHLCRTCRYRGASGLNGCDYILFEGHSRGCKVEECSRYERGARKRVEKVKGIFPRK